MEKYERLLQVKPTELKPLPVSQLNMSVPDSRFLKYLVKSTKIAEKDSIYVSI